MALALRDERLLVGGDRGCRSAAARGAGCAMRVSVRTGAEPELGEAARWPRASSSVEARACTAASLGAPEW